MRDQVTIRMASAADGAALQALEALDAHRLPGGDVLVAEVEGEVRAALPVRGGAAVADPFRPTAALVELLALHAEQLRDARPRAAARPRHAVAVATR